MMGSAWGKLLSGQSSSSYGVAQSGKHHMYYTKQFRGVQRQIVPDVPVSEQSCKASHGQNQEKTCLKGIPNCKKPENACLKGLPFAKTTHSRTKTTKQKTSPEGNGFSHAQDLLSGGLLFVRYSSRFLVLFRFIFLADFSALSMYVPVVASGEHWALERRWLGSTRVETLNYFVYSALVQPLKNSHRSPSKVLLAGAHWCQKQESRKSTKFPSPFGFLLSKSKRGQCPEWNTLRHRKLFSV